MVSEEETERGKKCCEDKYWIFQQHAVNKFDHTGLRNTEHTLKGMESPGQGLQHCLQSGFLKDSQETSIGEQTRLQQSWKIISTASKFQGFPAGM